MERRKYGRRTCVDCYGWFDEAVIHHINIGNQSQKHYICDGCLQIRAEKKAAREEAKRNREILKQQKIDANPYWGNRRYKTENGIAYKYCHSCDEWKTLSEFGLNNSAKDGTNSKCRECTNKGRRGKKLSPEAQKKANQKGLDYYYKNRETLLPLRRDYSKKLKAQKKLAGRKCRVCQNRKPPELFIKSICNDCIAERLLQEQARKAESEKRRKEQKERGDAGRKRRAEAHQRRLAEIAYMQTDEYREEKKRKESESRKRRRAERKANGETLSTDGRRAAKHNRRARLRGVGGRFDTKGWT